MNSYNQVLAHLRKMSPGDTESLELLEDNIRRLNIDNNKRDVIARAYERVAVDSTHHLKFAAGLYGGAGNWTERRRILKHLSQIGDSSAKYTLAVELINYGINEEEVIIGKKLMEGCEEQNEPWALRRKYLNMALNSNNLLLKISLYVKIAIQNIKIINRAGGYYNPFKKHM